MRDVTGLKFGKLLAIKPTEKRAHNSVLWLCKCDCGNEVLANVSTLIDGRTRSCGCLKKEVIIKMHNATRKHFGCLYCGSDKHYAKGCCKNCYYKARRGTLDFVR